MHEEPRDDRLIVTKHGVTNGLQGGPAEPELLDPIVLGGSGVLSDQGNFISSAQCDPLLLCEVGRDMGRDMDRGCSFKQQGGDSMEAGPYLLAGPVEKLGEDVQVVNKDSVLGLEMGCDLLVGDNGGILLWFIKVRARGCLGRVLGQMTLFPGVTL